jgi:hypothetical protein
MQLAPLSRNDHNRRQWVREWAASAWVEECIDLPLLSLSLPNSLLPFSISQETPCLVVRHLSDLPQQITRLSLPLLCSLLLVPPPLRSPPAGHPSMTFGLCRSEVPPRNQPHPSPAENRYKIFRRRRRTQICGVGYSSSRDLHPTLMCLARLDLLLPHPQTHRAETICCFTCSF